MAPKITIYTKEHCQPCKATKRKLAASGLPFEEVALADVPDKVDAFRAEGLLEAPIVEVDWSLGRTGANVKRWSGFRPDKHEEITATLEWIAEDKREERRMEAIQERAWEAEEREERE